MGPDPLPGFALVDDEKVFPLANDDVELPVQREGPEDRLAERGASEGGGDEGRHREGAAHVVPRLELLGEVLVEEADDDREVRPEAPRVERDLEVHGVVVGHGEERLGLHEAGRAEQLQVAGVAGDEGRPRGLGRAPPLGVRPERHDDGALAEPAEKLHDPEADVPHPADEEWGGAGGSRSPSVPRLTAPAGAKPDRRSSRASCANRRPAAPC